MGETEFLGFQLIDFPVTDGRDGLEYIVDVYTRSNRGDQVLAFSEKTFITGTAMSMEYGERDPEMVAGYLREKTLRKARGRINLGQFNEGEEYRQTISSRTLQNEVAPPPDSVIRRQLLESLRNMKRQDPLDRDLLTFDDEGFCEILGIDKKTYQFNASLLIEDGLITGIGDPPDVIYNKSLRITSEGVRRLEEDRAPERGASRQAESTDGDPVERPIERDYDVAISFAGEDRNQAEAIAEALEKQGVAVFYDAFEEDELWGKNLYDYLSDVYLNRARFCLILVSKHYKEKSWTNLERQAAQARALREADEYILPVRLDDTEIPGMPESVGYVPMRSTTPDRLAVLVNKKLAKKRG